MGRPGEGEPSGGVDGAGAPVVRLVSTRCDALAAPVPATGPPRRVPARPAQAPPPPGHPGAPYGGYPPVPRLPPAAFTAGYRRTAWALIWVPVALMVTAGVLSVVLLAYADADPVNNSGAGYLALLLWGVMLVGGPLLLGAFIPGCVMLSRSSSARAVLRAAGHRPPA